MAYTNPDTMNEIANILDTFSDSDLDDLFKNQITGEESLTAIPVNNFIPILYSYKRAKSIRNTDEDDIDKIATRFHSICINIINLICSKFHITIDSEWIDANYDRLPAITLSFYQFFQIDAFNIILEVLNNYIANDIDTLANTFADTIQNKDVSTLSNLKTMNPKYATVVSVIYDVTDYIFTMLDNDLFFSYISPKYTPGMVIKKLFDDKVLIGDFPRAIGDIYKNDLQLRSKISFELIGRIKDTGYLTNNPIVIHNSEIAEMRRQAEEDAKAANEITDIESDVDE